ncbi:hypothetical protein Taro_040389 [Colocasia esculenta]|uniref:Protein SGT1 homolog n=1 Tax=Colocasia esculenta TaxID=4460 RepID=A0A843WSW0_COLES|nr:hypothetical protein [Colocasia esculenta]
MVDADDKNDMRFFYEAMDRYFFNPRLMYADNAHVDGEVLQGTLNVIGRLSMTPEKRWMQYRMRTWTFSDSQLQYAVGRVSPEETSIIPSIVASTLPSYVSPPSVMVTENSKDLVTSMDISSVKQKYRHDYYNTPTEVVLTIFAKHIPSGNVHVDFGEQVLSVSIEVSGEESYHFQPRLFGKIIPDKCRYTVLSSKIEIRLAKADAITWTSLEFSKNKVVPQKINVSSVSGRPTYPSSKSKVDWDKLEAEVKKQEKDEKLEGDAALNKLFCDIYRDADEDARRAMRKSFVESNGTVLSTNWKEVGAKEVEGTAPDGMELRKWEY